MDKTKLKNSFKHLEYKLKGENYTQNYRHCGKKIKIALAVPIYTCLLLAEYLVLET
jgi:hypothetical protein